ILSAMVIDEILPLDQILKRRAADSPRWTFVKFEGKKYSYRDIDRLADTYASFLLRAAVKPGDRIALLSCNCHLYIAAYFGIIRSGCVVVPINNLLTHEEIGFILDDAAVDLMFFDNECSGTVRKLRENSCRLYVPLSEAAEQAKAAPQQQSRTSP